MTAENGTEPEVSVISKRLRQIAATLTSAGEVDTLLYAADQLAAPVKTTALAGVADPVGRDGMREALAHVVDRWHDTGGALVDQLLAFVCDTVPREQYRRQRERSNALAHVIEQVRASRRVTDIYMPKGMIPLEVATYDVDRVDRILAAAPAVSLAGRDAEVWERGRTAGSSVAMRRMSDEPSAPDAVNPYRAAAAGEEIDRG